MRSLWLELPEWGLHRCHPNPDSLAKPDQYANPVRDALTESNRNAQPNCDTQRHSQPEPESNRDALWAGRDRVR